MEKKKYKIKVYASKGMTDILIHETESENITTERIDLMRIERLAPFSSDTYLHLDVSIDEDEDKN